MGSWPSFPEPPQAECTGTVVMRDRGGGAAGDDDAAFHWFRAAVLHPGCTLESPQAFKKKHLIRTPSRTCYFRTLMARLAPALVFLESSSECSNAQPRWRTTGVPFIARDSKELLV